MTRIVDVDVQQPEVDGLRDDPQEYVMRAVASEWGRGQVCKTEDLHALATYLAFEVQDRDVLAGSISPF